jgi:hypothetical protein
MSGLEIIGIVANAIAIVDSAFKIYIKYVAELASRYRHERLGGLEFISTLRLLDIAEVQTAHWNINCWKDEEMMNWKKTYTDGCNAVAIAVSRLVTQ